VSELSYCVNHPDVETYLRCNRCGALICPKCAVRTEVGYRCRSCVSQQQKAFYAEFRPVYYLIAAAVALPLALIGGWLAMTLGWFVLFLGPLVGLGIAEVAHRAIRRRRGRYTWLVVAGCVLIGGLPRLVVVATYFASSLASGRQLVFAGDVTTLVWGAVYLFGAVSTAAARLRPARR